jgi:hypothetical protein
MVVFGAVPSFAQSSVGDCTETNFQSEPFNNSNVRGSQQNQQGSCNVQSNDDTSRSNPTDLADLVEAFQNIFSE